MVYFFTSNVIDPPATIYVGKDKFESPFSPPPTPTLSPRSRQHEHPKLTDPHLPDEELIKFGWDCDIWVQFHADNLSSAHIYLRLTPGQTWDALPKELVEECAQLTKANSIEGNKKDNVTIVYTPWSNLHKNAGMATGQVGFVDPKKTKKHLIPTRLNAPLNRLLKTRTALPASSLPASREAHLSRQRAQKRAENAERAQEEERVARERREEKERRERGYEDLMAEGGGRSNEEGFDEEDFM